MLPIKSLLTLAVIQLDPAMKPENLPSLVTPLAPSDPNNPESAFTQTLIFFVGDRIIAPALVFAATVTIIFLILSGYNYITAFGKDEKIEKGKRGIFWSLFGLLIILASYSIVQAILSIISQVDIPA
jgi:hypothetical protein